MEAASVRTDYGHRKDLVGTAGTGPYLFVEHTVRPQHSTPFRLHPADHRTFLVIGGRVDLELRRGAGTVSSETYRHLTGWHALPGCVYRITNSSPEPALLVEAGTVAGGFTEGAAESLRPGTTVDHCPRVAGYTVHKPWGFEVWYTQNLAGPGYAMKQIHMTAGHQSSLQSHRYKEETNYVIEGEATVLTGLTAPAELDAVIEMEKLTTTVHRARSGWTSPPNELHRVIARSDYTSIEVSTPELDDVIRWQDDTGRSHGRIDSEHATGRS